MMCSQHESIWIDACGRCHNRRRTLIGPWPSTRAAADTEGEQQGGSGAVGEGYPPAKADAAAGKGSWEGNEAAERSLAGQHLAGERPEGGSGSDDGGSGSDKSGSKGKDGSRPQALAAGKPGRRKGQQGTGRQFNADGRPSSEALPDDLELGDGGRAHSGASWEVSAQGVQQRVQLDAC